MRNLLRDVRFGVRLLARNPGFTAIAVLTLGLGIGANTAIFSVVYGTLIEPLPYHDPEQLVMVWSKPRPDGRNATAAGAFLEWRAQSTVFQGLHAWTGRSVSLAIGNDRPEQLQAAPVTPGWIRNFGLRLQLGRDFLPEEGEVGRDDKVILSHKPLAGEVRRRPGARRPADPARRPAAHGRGRAPARTRRPCSARSLPAARVHARPDQPRLPLAQRHGPPQAGRDARAGERRDERYREPHRRGAPGFQEGLGHQRRAAAEQLPPAQHHPRALVPARRRELRAADRVRQRREPAARARGGTPARGCGALVPRRLASAHRHSVPGRERRARGPRRTLRGRAGRGAHASVPGRDAGLHAALRSGRAAEHPGAALQPGARRSSRACCSAAPPRGRRRVRT